jgi:hypothetical protein
LNERSAIMALKRPSLLALVLGVYLLPSALALARRHRNRDAVIALNVLAGWTIVGWVIALVWAAYRDPSSY